MDKNIVQDVVVPASVSLEDKEGYAVGSDGVLTAALGEWAAGVVYEGMPADQASPIIIRGRCTARVNGASVNIAVDDPLCASSNGKFEKATIGTHEVRAHAKAAVTTDTTAEIELL